MKITTRIISGYGLFIAVLAGLVAYQIITINRMQSISRTLSQISFQNVRTCLEAMRRRDLVDEFTWKSFALPDDADYLRRLKEAQRDFAGTLGELRRNASSPSEDIEVERLAKLWDRYMADIEALRPGRSTVPPETLKNGLEQLQVQARSVYEVNLASMSSKVERSHKTGETAVLVLWCATFFAFAVSILVSLLIVRSISKPLAHLTEGTRAIADGKFFYRLDTSRNDEFSQLASDFNKMTLRLNELDELKKDFVSHVSHELKAPLASMRETIQLLLEQIPGPLNEKQRRLLELNLQSGSRLTSMISNLLDLSKIEAGAMEYELKKQELVPLVRNALAELEMPARERQVQLRAELPDGSLPVECDSDRIVQVILNLVGNAVKFSPRQGAVLIRVEEVSDIPERTPERWRRLIENDDRSGSFGLVTVTDSGPGIPDEDKERIFEKFHQVKRGTKMPGQGVGLGLSICRTIIEAHRGAIWVEDNPSGGSRFSFLLRPGESEREVVAGVSSPL